MNKIAPSSLSSSSSSRLLLLPTTTIFYCYLLFLLFLTAVAPTRSMTTTTISSRFRTWPITAVRALEPELRRMGLNLTAADIDGTTTTTTTTRNDNDNPTGKRPPLSDALVSVGAAGRGGTGSFVSSSGLILTNWHVAYDAARQASLRDNTDYVATGFVAQTLQEELAAPNYEVWITIACQDVSEKVVAVLREDDEASDESAPQDSSLQRANKVRDKMEDIAQTAQQLAQEEGVVRCDVQEMLPNESYVLFTYRRFRDVRIAYVPPKPLGNFGGDTDNFEWPRHTADFTLLRAYVSPTGQAAPYSPENVPYRPKSFLRVQPQGCREGDFVFVLGFPGRTMRYAPTSRLLYSDQVAVPNDIQDFARKLELIAEYEQHSPEAALKLGTSKKGLANEFKRSQGKLIMMRKLQLIPERKKEEEELCAKAPRAQEAYAKLSEIYNEFRAMDPTASALESCRGIYHGSTLLAAGHAVNEYLQIEIKKDDGAREAAYRDRNLAFLCKRLAKRIGDLYIPHETALVRDALEKLAATPELKSLHETVAQAMGSTSNLETIVQNSKLRDFNDGENLKAMLAEKNNELQTGLMDDPFVQCANILWETYEKNRDRSKALLSERDALFALLLDLQRQHSGEKMYPDCNGSLRLSAGYMEGYQGADAVEYKPQTTLAGLLDKATEAKLSGSKLGEFSCPERLYDMLVSDSSIQQVPVCLLYSTDTVGGNSGSPVMNADGELVGINFDRQRQGLMNEFKWSKDYSRSIGVDVRYMLWLMGEYDGASNLVEEMLS
mmetsp:Transcript_4213/g.11455  ORF Transcript_4213/g.11455 Transcript_4213/m.11455 type:complete len:779 (+) Transcript_4213:51-2387(+)